MTASAHDRLVDEWLARVDRAAADLPPEQRRELLNDLREHITVARADLPDETEAGVRTILERLGDPAVIAAEARYGEAAPAAYGEDRAYGAAAAPAVPPMSPATDPPVRGRRAGLWIGLALAAVALLCVGCAVAGLGLFAWGGVTSVNSEVVEVPFEGPPRPLPHPASPSTR